MCVWNGQNFFFHINDESEQANSGNTSYNPSFTSNLKIGGGGPYVNTLMVKLTTYICGV